MMLVAAALFYGVETLFARIAFFDGEWAVWWPVNGIALGVLLAVPRRHWWWILLALAVGTALAEPNNALGKVAVGICDTLEALLPALALPRFRTMDKWLSQPKVAWRFSLLAIVAAPMAAGMAAPFYNHGLGASYWVAALRWGSSDALGTALFTPLLLALLGPEIWQMFRPRALPATLGLIAVMTGSSWFLFHENNEPIAFVVYPVILLVSTQLGLGGSVIGVNLLAVIATAATLGGRGPFAGAHGSQPATGLLILQLFLVLSISMTLPVSVARVRRLTTEKQLTRAWQKMEELVSLDGLTGVANRRRFDAVLALEWARALRERAPLALMMIDVDRFKAFNDTYGHLAGDACLRSVAAAIAAVPGRPNDLVARYGGEEFAILLPAAELAGAAKVAELARRAVYDLALPHLGSELHQVTISVGVAAMVPNARKSREDLIAAADTALYEAKHTGRNQVRTAQDAGAPSDAGDHAPD
jgi:diguanylate cyclase (GGDEF)-like protein